MSWDDHSGHQRQLKTISWSASSFDSNLIFILILILFLPHSGWSYITPSSFIVTMEDYRTGFDAVSWLHQDSSHYVDKHAFSIQNYLSFFYVCYSEEVGFNHFSYIPIVQDYKEAAVESKGTDETWKHRYVCTTGHCAWWSHRLHRTGGASHSIIKWRFTNEAKEWTLPTSATDKSLPPAPNQALGFFVWWNWSRQWIICQRFNPALQYVDPALHPHYDCPLWKMWKYSTRSWISSADSLDQEPLKDRFHPCYRNLF